MPTFFEIVGATLDRIYGDLPEEGRDNKISTSLDALLAQYKEVLAQGGPSYEDGSTRFAYVFRYATAHADYLNSIIGWTPELRSILKRDVVDICCIGGGPGSDVLGFLKFLLQQRKKPQLTYFVLDKEAAWGETWADLDKTVSEDLKTSKNYLTCDFTEPDSYTKFSRPFKADIFTMIYFLSEIFKSKDAMTTFLKHLVAQMTKGALIVVLDFHDTRLEEWIDDCGKNGGLETLTSIQTRMTLDPSEEKRALKKYTDKFGAPKLQAEVFVRVFMKT